MAESNPEADQNRAKPESKAGTAEKPWVMSDATLEHVIAKDRNRARLTAGLLFVVLAGAAGGLAAFAIRVGPRLGGVPAASIMIVAAFLLVAAVVAPLAVLGLQRARKRRWQQRQRECEELTDIAGEIKDKALGKLINFNFRLMDRFVAVAIGQARASYIACALAATAGLLVLLVGATIVLTVHGLAAQITAGGLTAVGSVLSSYLSVTFLHTFQMTSKQMSYYYGQPLVHCYLLHAEWLGERFEQDADPINKWETRHELIRAVLGASHNAQNHLLDLQLGSRNAAPPAGSFLDHEPAPRPLSPALDVNGHKQ